MRKQHFITPLLFVKGNHPGISKIIEYRLLVSGTSFRHVKAFADDIRILADQEKCDVIVDDISYLSE